MNTESAGKLEPAAFETINVASHGPNSCSPEVDDPEWLGIEIAMPQRAFYELHPKTGAPRPLRAIPICGILTLDVPLTPVDASRTLVVRDLADDTHHRIPLDERSPDTDAPPPEVEPDEPEDEADKAGMVVSEYFNLALNEYFSVPSAPGRYEVWVEFRGYVSNHMVLEVAPLP